MKTLGRVNLVVRVIRREEIWRDMITVFLFLLILFSLGGLVFNKPQLTNEEIVPTREVIKVVSMWVLSRATLPSIAVSVLFGIFLAWRSIRRKSPSQNLHS